jgi:hypothetical protein
MKTTLVILSVLVMQSAMAGSVLRCFDTQNKKTHTPVLAAEVVSKGRLNNVTFYDEMSGKETSSISDIEGAVNPRSRKYVGYIYFSTSTVTSNINLILPPNFVQLGSFTAFLNESASDGGGKTILHCLNSK